MEQQQTRQILVKVRADFACFTCPDFGAERVSYPVMTPSAARGVLESIFWKPEMRYIIEQIRILRGIQYQSFKRNEISKKLSLSNKASIKGRVSQETDRIQINTVALLDVEYVIACRIALVNQELSLAKYYDIFMRRLERGQCFQRPFLGMREFTASFEEATGEEPTIDHTQNLGKILMKWDNVGKKRIPRFFDGRINNGVLHIPMEARC